jgi:hypothetical protein
VILDIKHYIFKPVPSKPILPKLTIALITIDHQMAVMQLQVRKNFIKDVLLNGGFGFNIILEKLRYNQVYQNQNLHLIIYVWLIKPLPNF